MIVDDDNSTILKLNMVGYDYMDTLLEHIDMESIPKDLGGDFDQYYVPFEFNVTEDSPLYYPGAPLTTITREPVPLPAPPTPSIPPEISPMVTRSYSNVVDEVVEVKEVGFLRRNLFSIAGLFASISILALYRIDLIGILSLPFIAAAIFVQDI